MSTTAIKVSDLPSTITEDILRQLFSRFGMVENVRLFYRYITEPFAIIVFASPESARKARMLNGFVLGGCVLEVE